MQRVSDSVAILNQGELVAQGPVEELLAGGEGIAYTVTLKGGVESAYQRISRQEWVASIQSTPRNGATIWTVGVTDDNAAQSLLLRLLLADERLVVSGFGRKEYELEDIFVSLVEGVQDDSR